jgi:hypothetical protein
LSNPFLYCQLSIPTFALDVLYVVHVSEFGTKALIDPLQCHSLSLHRSPHVKKMGPTTLSQKKNLGVAISCDMRQSLLNRLEEVERIIMESFAPRIIIFIRDYKPKEEDNGHVRVGFGNSSRCHISSKT